MTFQHLQLLFPILVALHNTEEAVYAPRWRGRSSRWFGGSNSTAFRLSLVVFTALAILVTALSAHSGRMTLWGNVTFGYMVAILINAFVPHLAVSISQRTLMPGVITAVTLNLPILTFLAALALKQGYVSTHDALAYSLAVPLSLLALMLLFFRMGRLVRK